MLAANSPLSTCQSAQCLSAESKIKVQALPARDCGVQSVRTVVVKPPFLPANQSGVFL
jgi:hypothetical protein